MQNVIIKEELSQFATMQEPKRFDLKLEENLIKACKENNNKQVNDILQSWSNINVNYVHKKLGTALMTAVVNDNETIVRLLLSKKADVLQESTFNSTPLHYAASKGEMEMLHLLLEENFYVTQCQSANSKKKKIISLINTVDKDGNTLLHAAVDERKSCTALYLLQRNANMTLRNSAGKTPLTVLMHWHCPLFLQFFGGDELKTLVQAIMLYGRNLVDVEHAESYRRFYQLAECVMTGNVKALGNLLARTNDVDFECINEESLLYLAIQGGQAEAFKMLINKGANPNVCKSIAPLHAAVVQDSLMAASILLQRFADIDITGTVADMKGVTPFYVAVVEQNYRMAEFLISRGADINKPSGKSTINDYDTPLHSAIGDGKSAFLKMMLKNGADVNAKDGHGRTPLHRAVDYKDFKAIDVLLEHNAQPNFPDNYGQTPLHLMCLKMGRFEESIGVRITRTLLSKGSRTDLRDKDGRYPLHVLAESDHSMKVFEELMKTETSCKFINAKNNAGETPLYTLSKKSSSCEKMLLFLRHGADLNIKTDEGKLPDLPCFCKHNGAKCPFIGHLHRLKLIGYELDPGHWEKRDYEDNSSDYTDISDSDVSIGEEDMKDLPALFRKIQVMAPKLALKKEEIRTTNVYDSEDYDEVIESYKFLVDNIPSKWEKKYLEELRTMKNTAINQATGETLYDFFSMKRNAIVALCKHGAFDELFARNKRDFKNIFPTYGGVLNIMYRRAQHRSSVLKEGKKFLNKAVGQKLPKASADLIVSYLSNLQLNDMKEENEKCQGI